MPPMGKGRNGYSGKPKNTAATIKRLFSYLNEYKLKIGFAFLCVIVSTASNLAGSYMLRPIINGLVADGLSAEEKIAKLLTNVGIMALIYLFGILANYLQQRTMINVSQNALFNLRKELFTKMQKLPVRFFDTRSTGEVMSRYTNDVDTIGEMLNSTIVQIFQGSIQLLGTLALMIYTNIFLTIVTVVTTPLIAFVGGTIAKKSRTFFKEQQSALGVVNGYVEETVTGQNVVKVFCHEDKIVEGFTERNEKLRSAQIKAQFIGGMMGPVMNAMGQISYTLTATVGALLCLTTGITRLDVGGLSVFVNYSRQFARPINELSMQMTVIMSALAGAERVF